MAYLGLMFICLYVKSFKMSFLLFYFIAVKSAVQNRLKIKNNILPCDALVHHRPIRALILFIQTLALYKSFTYLLTYIVILCLLPLDV